MASAKEVKKVEANHVVMRLVSLFEVNLLSGTLPKIRCHLYSMNRTCHTEHRVIFLFQIENQAERTSIGHRRGNERGIV